MAGIAEIRGIAFKKLLNGPRMAVMAGQAFPLIGGSMYASDSGILLSLFMAGQAYLGRSIVKHAGVLTGMLSMACQAVPLLDWLM
jgi:hypothetical protein